MNQNYSRHAYTVLAIFILFLSHSTNAQVGIGNTNPAESSLLDVRTTANNKGILIPRVNITNLATKAPVTTVTIDESLLVYNTNTTTGKGFYYWDGTKWAPLTATNQVTKGFQYYSYNINPSISPNLSTVERTTVIAKSGSYTGLLDNSALAILKPSNDDGFIIKIMGTYQVKNAGVFNLTSLSDDGNRIYVDGSLIVNAWSDSSGNAGSGSVNLGKGKHKFEFWYYENTGGQSFTFNWGTNPDGNTGEINATQFTIE